MDSVVEIQPEIGSDGVGEKRLADDVELEEPAPKKARGVVIGNTKKVAEMVLVLAALGKIRGGRVPTAAEREMMTEARENLAQVCQSFAPKDVFPRDAFGAVIEDLGLNKLKDQRLGFRPPKVSIAEKLQIAKEKVGQLFCFLFLVGKTSLFSSSTPVLFTFSTGNVYSDRIKMNLCAESIFEYIGLQVLLH
uniref:PHD finger family protein n=1 Tax=Solanum tuberosum TaxID=4113 RepID=M1AZ53_SOLTU